MSALAIIAALAAQGAPDTPTQPTASQATGPTPGSTAYFDVEVGAGYSSNPFLRFGSDTGRGFGRISGHGVYTQATQRTTTVISAFAQDTTYTSRYGSEQSFDINAHHDARVSEQLRLFGDVDAALDQGGQLDTRIIGVPVLSFQPGLPPVLILPGNDFLTVTGKEYRLSGHVGGQLALSPRDDLNFSAGAEHITFKTGGIDTRYTTIPVSIGYDRQINERTRLGVEVNGSHTEYNGPTHYDVISPEVTGRFNLAEHLTLTAAAGAAFTSVDDGIRTRHSTGFTGNVNLCSLQEHATFCARASADEASPTAAGPARSVSVGVDYSRRLDAKQTVDVALGVDHYSSPAVLVSTVVFSHATYFRAVADYSRNFGHRWFGGINMSARKVTQNGPDPKADVSASLFIRYRFGDVR